MATKKKPAAAPAPPKRKPAKASASVATFMAELEHPLKAEIEALRGLVLGAHTGITEQIKWNAPSFCFGGDDRVTFRRVMSAIEANVTTPRSGVMNFSKPLGSANEKPSTLFTLAPRWKINCSDVGCSRRP